MWPQFSRCWNGIIVLPGSLAVSWLWGKRVLIFTCSSTWKRYHNFSFVCQESVQEQVNRPRGAYHLHKGGNLVHENKTIKFDVVGERPTTMYKISKTAEHTKKSTKIASPQITAHVFRSSPKGRVRNIWFSNLNFRISPTNGKYPISLQVHSTQSTFFTLCKQNTATSKF